MLCRNIYGMVHSHHIHPTMPWIKTNISHPHGGVWRQSRQNKSRPFDIPLIILTCAVKVPLASNTWLTHVFSCGGIQQQCVFVGDWLAAIGQERKGEAETHLMRSLSFLKIPASNVCLMKEAQCAIAQHRSASLSITPPPRRKLFHRISYEKYYL